ncbi:MAG: phosphoglucosamine mutase [Chitinophagaceae bacterium]|nr:MAG: phosphoglucosamine mutase [Chitinophagaceae bacterium]
MPLIKSISGIRGTIGDQPGENLSPIDIVKFTTAFAGIITQNNSNAKIVIGRDGRISGQFVRDLVVKTLIGLGIDVIDLGLTTTPTVEIAVKQENAAGGIIITASHNPQDWNALKLLNSDGEFISSEIGLQVLEEAEKESIVSIRKEGKLIEDNSYLQKHVDAVVNYPLVNVASIKAQNFKIVVDAINSTGALYVPALLKALGVEDVVVINGKINGKFAHNPEPLPDNLRELSREVVKQNASLGIAVDPDVDRLCFVCEDGSMFGEEYTLVAVADYILSKKKGSAVSNLSSTRALADIASKHHCDYFASPVGEVNVVKKMKEVNAVIGGEGNGGIIVSDFHYGRDALIGIGIFLSYLSEHTKGMKSFRSSFPNYFISKNKIELQAGIDIPKIFEKLSKKYKNYQVNTEDGLKIEFDNDWVHLRSSNTEPIIRIYAESNFETTAQNIARRFVQDIGECLQ